MSGVFEYEKEKTRLSFVVPYYNEEDIIKENVTEILRQLEIQFPRGACELILVNDNSSDRSPELIAESGTTRRIRLINFTSGPSHRENMAVAMRQARGDIICFFDMDLSCDIGLLRNLIDTIEVGGFDIAIGDRFHPLSTVRRDFGRNLISRIYNPLVRIALNSRLRDHQCGFKAFKKEILISILDEMGYDRTLTRGWFWDTELLLRAQRMGYQIKEIPVKWQDSSGRKGWLAFIRDEFKIVIYILRVFKELR